MQELAEVGCGGEQGNGCGCWRGSTEGEEGTDFGFGGSLEKPVGQYWALGRVGFREAHLKRSLHLGWLLLHVKRPAPGGTPGCEEITWPVGPNPA